MSISPFGMRGDRVPLVVKCNGESEEVTVEGGIIVRLWGFHDGFGGMGGSYIFC